MLEISRNFITQKNLVKQGTRGENRQNKEELFNAKNNKILITNERANKMNDIFCCNIIPKNICLDKENSFIKKYQKEKCKHKSSKISKLFLNQSTKLFTNAFFISFFIISNILIFINTQNVNHRKLASYNDIVLKISGTGPQQVLKSGFSSPPNCILVNGENKTFDTNFKISLEDGENYVTLRWESESEPTKYDNMFEGLTNIIEADFSNFVFSQPQSLYYTFKGCSSLKAINFNNEIISAKISNFLGTFRDCFSLTSIDLTSFDTSETLSTANMFYGCKSLKSIDFSTFNTPFLTITDSMFLQCSSLTSLDLSHFETSKVTSMKNMFERCEKLESLDLSNFNASEVKSMANMFSNCKALTSLDLPFFDKSQLTDMRSLFSGCSSLTSIDLSCFNTSKVSNMCSVFYGCSSLVSLDLSNFNTEHATQMSSLFSGCSSLTSLDLSNFNTEKVVEMMEIFNGCSSLISLNLSNFNTEMTTDMEGLFYGCSSLISLDLSNFITNHVEYIDYIFESCSKLKYLDISNFNLSSAFSLADVFASCDDLQYINMKNIIIPEELPISDFLSGIPDNVVYCISNGGNIVYTIGSKKECPYNDCSEDWYKNKAMYILASHTCTRSCSDDETYQIFSNYKCYSECPTDTHMTIINKEKMCIDDCANGDLPFIKNYECVESCNSKDFFKKVCIMRNENIETIEYMVNIISNEIANNVYSFIEQESVINYQHGTYHVTTTQNQLMDLENNDTRIILNECENILKEKYGLNSNEDLIIYKMDYFFDEFLIPITEYQVFSHSLNVKLNLNFCKNAYIYVLIPVDINEDELYKHQPDSDYYSNSCFPDTTSTDCADINVLNQRRNEFNSNNLSLCEKDCNFLNYDTDAKKVKCSCPVKTSFTSLSELRNNKNNLLFILGDYNKIDTTIFSENDLESTSETVPEIESKTVPETDSEINSESDSENHLESDYDNTYKSDLKNDSDTIESSFILTDGHSISGDQSLEIPSTKISTIISLNTYIPIKKNISIDEVKNSFSHFFKNISNSNKSLDSLVNDFLSNGENSLVVNQEDLSLEIVPSDKQNEIGELSVINLGDCEAKLKQKYKINDDESLVIVKIDYYNTGYLVPKVEYDVYNPLTLEKLDLDVCNDTKIDILLPVSLKEDDLFKYNTSSEYYNDFCFPYTTEDGTDIILTDRKNEYVDNNMSLCDSNCEYTGYNNVTKKAVCNCEVRKDNISLNSEIGINKEDLLKTFIDIKSRLNLKSMKCYKLLFSKKGLISNIGSYVLLSIIFVDSFMVILFVAKGFMILSNKINFVRTMLKASEDLTNFNDKHDQNSKKSKMKKKSKNKNKMDGHKPKTHRGSKKNKMERKDSHKISYNNPNKKKAHKSSKSIKISINEDKTKSIQSRNNENSVNNITDEKVLKSYEKKRSTHKKNTNISEMNVSVYSKNKANKINEEKPLDRDLNIYKYNDYEMNNLLYEEAIKIDNRTYFQYYFSLLKQKQLLIFTFYTNTDYNSRYIKIVLFFFSFALYLTINTLFFDETTMHQIYKDKGSFNFIYNLPKIFYSTMISSLINIIITFLSLTEKDITKIKMKVEKEKQDLTRVVSNTTQCLKIKIPLFFLFNFLFLMFFWYYLSTFCAVYHNTQSHLFKDVLISFLTSLLYPFGLSLLPGFFRIPSLRDKNKDRKCLYNVSTIIQLI